MPGDRRSPRLTTPDIMARRSSKKVVYAALLGNVLVALTKFAAAGLTGSSAMVSEAIHSLVDTGNEILLLHGLRRAARPPDELHPLGHGRELYFWSFIVTAASEVVSSICAITRAHPGVERSIGLFTVHLGPDQIVAAIGVDFVDTLSAAAVEAIVAAIEERVRNVHPEVVLLLRGRPLRCQRARRSRRGIPPPRGGAPLHRAARSRARARENRGPPRIRDRRART
jgi:divalent metal cation (Fe/Co/Zn/Cd) transporter